MGGVFVARASNPSGLAQNNKSHNSQLFYYIALLNHLYCDMLVVIHEEGEGFACLCNYTEKDYPKYSGFKYNPERGFWQSKNIRDVAKLLELAKLNKIDIEINTSVHTATQGISLEDYISDNIISEEDKERILQMSNKTSSDLAIPMPNGIQLFDYQKVGIEFLQNIKNVLLADEMGLGKTIQVIGYLNLIAEPINVLVVCPASIKLNWKYEINRFSIKKQEIQILEGKSKVNHDANIFIISYDLVGKFSTKLPTLDLIVIDEAHYIKNDRTKRSKSIFSLKADKKIALTGTPILNRPIEIYNIIKWLNDFIFPSKDYFGDRYCGGRYTLKGYILFKEYTGASNLDELQKILKSTIMIRRIKRDVIQELPPKTRQVIRLDELTKQEKYENQEIINKLKEIIEQRVHLISPNLLRQLAIMRQNLALRKLEYAFAHIDDLLENINKLVIFVHHKQVAALLEENFNTKNIHYVKIVGNMKAEQRQKSVTEFQNNDSIPVFIGSLKAANVGITLTAASTALFLEMDFSPSNVTQAEDRLHRIGQQENVLIQHMVFVGGLDEYIVDMLIRKQSIISQSLGSSEDLLDLL